MSDEWPRPDDVLNPEVDLPRLRKELLERIDIARRQLDSGEYTDYDDASLRRLFEELTHRATSRRR
ncbi:MAG: hypothetical protein HYS13_25900 [Planctomycetia bacterium]|nr:hypothetical protein [Planctomycetia bacterium]